MQNKYMPLLDYPVNLHSIYVIAEKGQKTLDLSPSLDIDRSGEQWQEVLANLKVIQQSPPHHHVHSVGKPPVRKYHHDAFFYIDDDGIFQKTLSYADHNHYESIKKKLLQIYNIDRGKIILLGTLADFTELSNLDGMKPALGDERLLLLSLYDAGKPISLNRFFKKDKFILPITQEYIQSNLLLNCICDHKDRLYLFNIANNLGARNAIDLCSEKDVAKPYWSQSSNTPSSQSIGRTYIKGLP